MKNLITSITLLMVFFNVSGQGCSDAGFCTMGAMRPSQVYTRKVNFKLKSLEISQYRGKTTLSPVVNASILDFNFGINEKTSFQIKLPYQWVNGKLGSTSDFGDISYSFTHNVYSSDKFNINATLGGKIPTNNADLKDGSKAEFTTNTQEEVLPMYYQTSLGTWDLVAGASLINKKCMFAFGVQAPIANSNHNSYNYEDWSNFPKQPYIHKYPLATDLKRGTDVMIRIERAIHFSNLDIRLGLLPIYRVSKDQLKSTDTGEYFKVDHTTGLALSGLFNVAYHFNAFNSINGMYGHKITDRDVNPDGLTRHNVISLAYEIKF
ncbi:hypothetical protein LVD15_16665 [Fulvivirga maritima]|uniref:hypothetical protein n=1 Tax=Fulvivirga maritima TaxID=2904247 RepID=UPI001F16F397|nr:hypothetical protein [Fulvivirga maritima]UII24933.1 hypothetical protein LVD15_16665 [Fulvivirga maritima]